MGIHPTAQIDSDANIAEDVAIGPFTVIGPEVKIGPGVRVGPNVTIEKWVNIGRDCHIKPGAVIGGAPQITGYKEQRSFVNIGDRTVIGEYVTIHRSGEEGKTTDVGNDCFLMAYSHLAHDCKIGNNVTIVNYTGLAGHIEVGDHATISGYVGLHQYVHIGRLTMVSGLSRIPKDVVPFALVEGNPASVRGLNVMGLKRSRVSPGERKLIKQAFKFLFWSELNTTQAIDKIKGEMDITGVVEEIVNFVNSSERGILK